MAGHRSHWRVVTRLDELPPHGRSAKIHSRNVDSKTFSGAPHSTRLRDGFRDGGTHSTEVINGVLLTHPVAGSDGRYSANRFYDSAITAPVAIDPGEALETLARFNRTGGDGSTSV